MKIRGIIESSNERGLKLDGRWYKFYTDEEIPRPEEGTEVEIEMRKGMIRKLNILKTITETRPAERPPILAGFTEVAETRYGNLYITINTLGGKPFEILMRMGKSSHWVASICETVGRLVSLALRGGISVKTIVEELQNIDKSSIANGVAVSIPRAVSQILIKNFLNEPRKESENLIYLEDCPNCNTERSIVFQGGCSTCHVCGFTDCY